VLRKEDVLREMQDATLLSLKMERGAMTKKCQTLRKEGKFRKEHSPAGTLILTCLDF
jgi:hypothetical protein